VFISGEFLALSSFAHGAGDGAASQNGLHLYFQEFAEISLACCDTFDWIESYFGRLPQSPNIAGIDPCGQVAVYGRGAFHLGKRKSVLQPKEGIYPGNQQVHEEGNVAAPTVTMPEKGPERSTRHGKKDRSATKVVDLKTASE
jgi:hypothetical protein